MLELQSISKRFGPFSIRDINLSLRNGEYFVLLGPTGVGKTVLLEMIAGLTSPDQGSIAWNENDITHHPPEHRGFALVYQDYALFPHLTVARNIAYGLKARRINKSEIHQRVDRIIKIVSIEQLAERYPVNLSGGEKQRVALARALVIDPKLLLLDEPLAALDLNVRTRLRRLLKKIHKQLGSTVLHVTHDVNEAISLGDRIGVLLDGKIQQIGPPNEVFQHPVSPEVADFLTLKNVLRVQQIQEGLCKVNGLKIQIPTNGHSIDYIWIRPEDILLSHQPFDSSARNQFPCKIIDWDQHSGLFFIRIAVGDITFTSTITHISFEELAIEPDKEMYCTFKSSAVHGMHTQK